MAQGHDSSGSGATKGHQGPLRGYLQLVKQVDRAFERVRGLYPSLVKCREGCSECCHAFFELTPIEALYLRRSFNRGLDQKRQEEVVKRAQKVHPDYVKIHGDILQTAEKGSGEKEVLLGMVGRSRIRCPLLSEEDLCELYPYRPITCRLYGIPLNLGGAARTCGLSGFVQGQSYPTADYDRIHERLVSLSVELMNGGARRWWRWGESVLITTALTQPLASPYGSEGGGNG